MTVDVAKSMRKMFIAGEWVDSESGEHFDADSPVTGEVIAAVPKGTRADAQRAVEAAHAARGPMAALKGFERAKRLHHVADVIASRRVELAHLLTLDQGKPMKAEALGEVDECLEYFRIAAEDLKRLEGRVLPSASPTKLVLARHYPRGVYGVITYLVDQGTRELGIRMALGATPGGITGMVIRQGLLLGGIGVAVGIAGALLLTRFLSSLLYGIEATDPLTFVAIGLLMMVVAIISSYIPARRAARIDPVISLRSE